MPLGPFAAQVIESSVICIDDGYAVTLVKMSRVNSNFVRADGEPTALSVPKNVFRFHQHYCSTQLNICICICIFHYILISTSILQFASQIYTQKVYIKRKPSTHPPQASSLNNTMPMSKLRL